MVGQRRTLPPWGGVGPVRVNRVVGRDAGQLKQRLVVRSRPHVLQAADGACVTDAGISREVATSSRPRSIRSSSRTSSRGRTRRRGPSPRRPRGSSTVSGDLGSRGDSGVGRGGGPGRSPLVVGSGLDGHFAARDITVLAGTVNSECVLRDDDVVVLGDQVTWLDDRGREVAPPESVHLQWGPRTSSEGRTRTSWRRRSPSNPPSSPGSSNESCPRWPTADSGPSCIPPR